MPMVRYWAGARELAGAVEETVAAATLADLLEQVGRAHGDAMRCLLPRCVVLVDGEQASGVGISLSERSLVEILPPYAGG